MDDHSVHERLRALERTLTDGRPVADLADEAAVADRLDELEGRLDELEDRLDGLDAATQALRGYVGNVRAVNRDVERRADAAHAAADATPRPHHAPASGADRPTDSDGDRARQRSGSPDDLAAATDGRGIDADYPNPIPGPPDRDTRSLRQRIADWL